MRKLINFSFVYLLKAYKPFTKFTIKLVFLLYHTVVQPKPQRLMIFQGNTITAIHLLCKQLPLFSITVLLLEGQSFWVQS